MTRRQHRTTLGYRTLDCRSCGRRFNGRNGTPLDDLQYPVGVVLLAVPRCIRNKLSFRETTAYLGPLEDTISEQFSGMAHLCVPQRRGRNTW